MLYLTARVVIPYIIIFIFREIQYAVQSNLIGRCLEIFGEVANLFVATDDTTKLLCFLKPHSFSNLNLPPE